jgi:hypothetical protein
VSDILTGRVIRAGTLPFFDDQAFDGIVVEIPRDQLANFPHRIVYAEVCVTLKDHVKSKVPFQDIANIGLPDYDRTAEKLTATAFKLGEAQGELSAAKARIAELEKQLAERG